MKQYFLGSLIIATQLWSLNLFAAPAFWCDAKEVDPTQISDVPEFKALKVKKILASGEKGDRTVAYLQTARGLTTLDLKDVQSSDIVSLIFQTDSGREFRVERFPNNNIRIIVEGSHVVTTGFTYLGISGSTSDGENRFILNCKSEL